MNIKSSKLFVVMLLSLVPGQRAHACYFDSDMVSYIDEFKAFCAGSAQCSFSSVPIAATAQQELRCACGIDGTFTKVVGLTCPSEIMPPPKDTIVKPTNPTSKICGSVIRPESRVVEENVAIAGTPFFLNYSSSRALDYSGHRRKEITPVPTTCIGAPFCPAYRTVSISVGNRSLMTNEIFNYASGWVVAEWDGLDETSNLVLGSSPMVITYIDSQAPGAPLQQPMVQQGVIGSFYAYAFGLGGWTISPVHFYDRHLRTVFRGDGSAYPAKATELAGPSYLVPSEDGLEVYFFDSTGRHTQTKTGVKGAVKYNFTYSGGKLATITDAFFNVTTINYTLGKPSSIVGPYGHMTALATDTNGYIAAITDPNSKTHAMTYSSRGMLTTFQKPNGVTSTMTYGFYGALLTDSSSAGGGTQLSMTSANNVQTTSAEGVAIEFPVNDLGRATLGPGARYFYENFTRDDSGRIDGANGINSLGDSYQWARTADPRSASVMYQSLDVINASQGARIAYVSKAATLTDPDNLFSVVDLTDSYILNYTKTTTLSYLSSTSKYTRNSPLNRKQYVTIDAYERPTSLQYATYTPTTMSYDSRGRVGTVAQGSSRTTTFTYNSNGNLQTITNPLSQVKTFGYDNVGRITSETLPDARVISYSYDANGNLASVTPPGGLAHTFVSNGFDLLETYTAPAISFLGLEANSKKAVAGAKSFYRMTLKWFADLFSNVMPVVSKKISAFSVNQDTEYTYNLDRKLTSITRPDGAVAAFSYDGTTGRLSGIATPVGSYTITQNPSYDRIDDITSPDGVMQTFTQDGSFLTSVVNSGTTSGSVYFTYNNDFLMASTKVNTAAVVNYGYDNDGLLTTAGNQSVTRNSATGFAMKATLANVSENYTYSATFGELSSIQGKYSTATNIYLESVVRDNLARITQKTETIGAGSANVYAYTFDSAGRLTTVQKNSAAFASYIYNSNSNRISTTRGGVTTAATFDEQDRIKTFGNKTYTHNDAGERTSVSDAATTPASVTSYSYDVFGNLKSVTLPGGSVISYILDGQNRRVGRKVGSTMNKQFVWFDQLRIGGELNGAGTVVSQFIYGLKGNVPDYMIKASVKYKIMTDHLGSVVAVVNSSTGAIAQAISYDEFGRVLSDTSPGFQPFGFAGGLYDSDTKIVTFGVRTYDAETGRWLSKDPILFGGGDTNLYGYVENDPINWIDPEGLVKLRGDGGGGGPLIRPPGPGGTVYVSPNGQAAFAPQGSRVYPTTGNNGLIIEPTAGRFSHIRMMDPSARNPEGFSKIQDTNGNFLNNFLNPTREGSRDAHICPGD